MTEQARPSPAAPLAGGLTLGRIFGIAVRADWSLLIIFALVCFSLGRGVLPDWHPDWTPLLTWGTALGASLLFFVSVLAHELSHALVARRVGIPVERVTLFLFGGIAEMEGEPPSPKAELLMAIVGPITSIAIGLLSLAIAGELAAPAMAAIGEGDGSAAAMQQALSGVGPGITLLLWLGPINLMLGVFNMVPGFPLDGGRVLRAILWWIRGDMLEATRWASLGGRLFAWALMAFGVLSLLDGMLTQGIWLLLIGWFLHTAARASYAQLLTRRALADVPVARLMWTHPARVAPTLSLEALVRDHVIAGDQHAFPVEAQGELLGLVVLDDVRKVPQTRWAETTVAEVMTPCAELTTLAPQDDAQAALRALAQEDVDQIPVTDGSTLRGLVRRRDVVRWLALQDAGPAHARP